jgi:archaellum component FlaG (FlaF/FlaG flagellin family)
VIGSVKNTSDLGDTAKLFEAINEDELKSKLQETFEGIKDIFSSTDLSGNFDFSNNFSDSSSNNSFNFGNMPNPEDLHNHINGLMNGKLGKLAMELAEETAQDLNLDMENISNAKDVFEKLFKNPTKLMSMVKNVGSKLDEKIKSGEIKESELMEEGMDLLNKMKNMPGMDNMQKIFSQMGMPGLGKGGKLNMGAMESQLNRNMKTAKMKERMKEKAENLSKMKDSGFCNMSDTNTNSSSSNQISDEEIFKIFSTGEKIEKTPRGAKPTPVNNNQSSNNKKQKKSKK